MAASHKCEHVYYSSFDTHASQRTRLGRRQASVTDYLVNDFGVGNTTWNVLRPGGKFPM